MHAARQPHTGECTRDEPYKLLVKVLCRSATVAVAVAVAKYA
ncbi:hypothetical protein [Streptomyces sp. NPDC018347]